MFGRLQSLTSRLPRSFRWFYATAVIFVLQAFPLTGIFLMFALAPFWSILTVNAGFLSLAVEAARGSITRTWLLAPLVWFGGYAAATTISHKLVLDLDQEFRAHNAARSMPFDATRRALVIGKTDDAMAGAAGGFVKGYDLDVAYEANDNFDTATHIAHRIGSSSLCAKIKADKSNAASGIYAFGFHEDRKFVKGLCAYYMPEDPTLPPVTVNVTSEKVSGLLLPYKRYTATISDAGGRNIELVAGHAAPLSWLPLPVMGCALNSGAPSWDCTAGFMRDSVGVGGDGAYGAAVNGIVASALKLRKSPASERRDRFAAKPPPAIDKVIAKRVTFSTDTLDAVLASPAKRVTVHDLKGLFERPDLIEARRDEIVAAAPVALNAKSRETARLLQSLLSILPGGSFAVAGRALLAEFNSRPALTDDDVSGAFIARLGDFGADAVPLLERLAFAKPHRAFSAAVVGLCRAGPAAVNVVDKISAQLQRSKRTGDGHSALYVALLRLGRPDLADADPDLESYYRSKDYAAWRGSITPASPPGVCDTVHIWPKPPEKPT